VGIDGKKMARLGSSLPFTLSLPLGISTSIARGTIRPSAKRAGELRLMSRNQLRIMMGLLTRHCQLKEYLLKMGLAGTTGCERSRILKQPHVLCDGEARLRDLGHHFWKPGDFANISVSKVLHLPFTGPCIMRYSYNKSKRDTLSLNFIW
jgi:hypothetical protein